MGHGIAQLAAQSGYSVSLMDIREEALGKAMERIKWSLTRLAEKGAISRERIGDVVGMIETTTSLEEAVVSADFVIEAVVEDINVKKDVFRRMDEEAPEYAVLASNTSTLPITEIASATSRPGRVVGMHFFAPPVVTPLVEVVKGEKTSEETLQLAVKMAERLGKSDSLQKRCSRIHSEQNSRPSTSRSSLDCLQRGSNHRGSRFNHKENGATYRAL